MIRIWIAALAAVLLLPSVQPVAAENFTFYHSPHRMGPWQGPPCNAERVFQRIVRQFNEAEAKYWHTGVRMAGIENAQETAFQDWDPPLTAKRFCTATVYLTAGETYKAPSKSPSWFSPSMQPSYSKAPTVSKAPSKVPTGYQRYQMYYWLRSEQGFAGRDWGVEFCLVGRDRHMAYAPHCRMLRPEW